MFRLKPAREESPRLPFPESRRRQRLAERRKRVELLVNRSLDRAAGFSWSADRRPARRGLARHQRIAAVAAAFASVGLVTAFLAASRAGLPALPPVIWVKEAAPPPAGDPARAARARELRMRIAEIETGGAAGEADLRRLREELLFERAMAEGSTRSRAR